MNRKQRRDALKAKPRWERQSPQAQMAALMKNGLTPEDVQKAFDEGVKVGQDTTAYHFTAAMCIALHDLYGFGGARFSKTVDRMQDIMINSFTTAELRDEMLRKLHIKIDPSDPFNLISLEE